jgi:hypothetical protein
VASAPTSTAHTFTPIMCMEVLRSVTNFKKLLRPEQYR